MEAFMMQMGHEGDSFYTEKRDKTITAYATYYKRKITTERVVVVVGDKASPTAYNMTKVTLVS